MDWRTAEAEFRPTITRDSIPATFQASAREHADGVAQKYKGGIYDRSLVESDVIDAAPEGHYADLTYEEMHRIVRRLSAGFRELGLETGDRVGLFS
ncbi:MAG: long-chain fatty acid--CoA ligase, partial [Halobaculum sp.]